MLSISEHRHTNVHLTEAVLYIRQDRVRGGRQAFIRPCDVAGKHKHAFRYIIAFIGTLITKDAYF